MSPAHPRAIPRVLSAALACLCALLAIPCDARAAADADAEPGIRILNSLRTEDVLLNALLTNRDASQRLVSKPLNSTTFATDALLARAVRHDAALRVLSYVVGCALPEGHSVKAKDQGGRQWELKGQAGLCPEWETGPASLHCQQYVSACLVARNNAFGKQVDLSLRGEDVGTPDPFNPTGASEAWSPMFQPCNASVSGLTPECGWRGEAVGYCEPFTPVALGAGVRQGPTCTSTPMGSIAGDRVLRVCEHPAGCFRDKALAEADHNTLNTCGGIQPGLTFTCPASGRYSVMSADYSRSAWPGSWVRPKANGGVFPAAPFGGFTFREGAFYGNLFDTRALAFEVTLDPNDKPAVKRLLPPVPGANQDTVYRNAFACHARDWVSQDAHLTSRVCANPPLSGEGMPLCVAQAAGPCEPGSYSSRPARCLTGDGARVLGNGDFENCTDAGGASWPEPITVYLRTSCDMTSVPVTTSGGTCYNYCKAPGCPLLCPTPLPADCL